MNIVEFFRSLFKKLHKEEKTQKLEITYRKSYPLLIKRKEIVRTPEYKTSISPTTKGVMEDYFFDYCISKSTIPAYRKLEIITRNGTYYPDIALIDEEKDVYIAIEIDEPYTMIKGDLVPIHYEEIDSPRENSLAQNGWEIIRFAEEQIVKFPLDCINYLNNTINNSESIFNNRVNRWSKSEAKKMIDIKYRDKYLPKEFSNIENTFKSEYSFRSLPIRGVNPSLSNEEFQVLNIETNTNQRLHLNTDSMLPKLCYIKNEVFWDKILNSEYGELIKKYNLLKKQKKNILRSASAKGMYLRAFGKINKGYFNLKNSSEFEFVCTKEFIKYYDNWWAEVKKKSAENNV